MKSLKEPKHVLDVIVIHRFLAPLRRGIALLISFLWFLQYPLSVQASQKRDLSVPSVGSTKKAKTYVKGSKKIPADGSIQLLDIEALSLDKPESAIKTVSLKAPARTLDCEILILGGGLGGVAAALKAWELSQSSSRHHHSRVRIVLAEETDWLGGQMTTQGVPALDENYLVETTGACLSYQRLRNAIRSYYSTECKLSPEGAQEKYLNPGTCWVSRLAFEPKVALDELNKLLEPALKDLSLALLLRHKAINVVTKRTKTTDAVEIKEVYLVNLDSGETIAIKPKLCIDASELGDALVLAKLKYSRGSDSRSQTGEPHAPLVGDPDNIQDFTYPFIVELRKGESHKIEKPSRYDELNQKGKFSLQGYKMHLPSEIEDSDGSRSVLPFWEYRRLIDAGKFADPRYPNDLAVINWDSNDVRGFNIVDVPVEVQAQHLILGKLVSLGFLYWLQNEAPRDDGGKGYPELKLRKDLLGTPDGLSKHPYIREARRAKTRYTIVEQDIIASEQEGARAKAFNDAVGIGLYPVDIHGHQEIPGAGQSTKPFQIPLGALIPEEKTNLLPGCKNIGTTHITNGAYRLHPIEWGIGEVQGALAAFSLANKVPPSAVWEDSKLLRRFQKILVESGTPIYWYDDVPLEHPDFAAIQFLSVAQIFPGANNTLHFQPDRFITRAEAAVAIGNLVFQSPLAPEENRFAGKVHDLTGFEGARSAIEACLTKSIMEVDSDNRFLPGGPLHEDDLMEMAQNKLLSANKKSVVKSKPANSNVSSSITRGQFASWLYDIATSPNHLGLR